MPVGRQDIALGVDGAQFVIAIFNVVLGSKHRVATRIRRNVIIKINIGIGIEDETQAPGDVAGVAKPGERLLRNRPGQQGRKGKRGRDMQGLDTIKYVETFGRIIKRDEVRAILPNLGMRRTPRIEFRAQNGDLLCLGECIGDDRVFDPVSWSVQQSDFDLAVALNHETWSSLADANKIGQSVQIDIDIEIKIRIVLGLREARVEFVRDVSKQSARIQPVILAAQEGDAAIDADIEFSTKLRRLCSCDDALDKSRAIADGNVKDIRSGSG